MIFNTASTVKNLSLTNQNRQFLCSGIGLLIGFLVLHPIKISFVEPEACAIIFSTASAVFKFMKQRNKKKKILCMLLLMSPVFFYLRRRSTKPEIFRLKFLLPHRSQIFQYRYFLLLVEFRAHFQ